MQTPSASDPSFKAILDKLQEQNNRGFLTQLAQLKSERETAGEDADKREEQLDQANENLKNLKDETSSTKESLREGLNNVSDDIIELQDQLDTANDSLSEIATAVTGSKESQNQANLSLVSIKEAITGLKAAVENVGYDVGKDLDSGGLAATISGIGMNTTKLLDELLKEFSLVRKLTEGSVEYSKEAAQYRNTSGRDVESKVSGKTSKDGGFIDFETARDTLSGQGERARKENKLSLISSITTTRSGVKPGDATASSLGADLGSSKAPEVVPTESSRNTSIKRARRERESLTGNVEKGGAAGNDKGEDKSEWQGLFKEIETGFKFFMTDGLSEKPGSGIFQTPSKEVEKKDREAKVSSPRQDNPETDNVTSTGEIQADAAKSDLELSKQMLDTTKAQLTELKAIREALAPSTPKELTEQKGAPSSTTEKEKEGGGSLLGDLASGAVDMLGKGKGIAGKAAGMGGKILGGLGKAAKFLGPAAAVAGAAYSGFEGYQNTNENFDIKEGEEATTGQKISSTLGGVVSGATLGLLDGKTASQGIHKAGAAVGDFFGGIGGKVKGAYGDAKETVEQAKNFVGDTAYTVGATAGANIDKYTGLSKQVGKAKDFLGIKPDTSQVSDAEGTKTFDKEGNLIKQASPTFMGSSIETDVRTGDVTSKYSQGPMQVAQTKFAAGGSQSTGSYDLGTAIVKTRKTLTAKQQAEADLASGISPEAPVSSKSTVTGEAVAAQPKSVDEIAMAEAKKYGRDTPNIDDKKAARLLAQPKSLEQEIKENPMLAMRAGRSDLMPADANNSGKMVAKTSTENADMGREAGKGGANNTVVSNNVSSNNTTKIVPMKASPRPEYTGSSLDRYTNRISVY